MKNLSDYTAKNTYQKNQAKSRLNTYYQSSDYSLSDVYGRYSDAKAHAFHYCQNLQADFNGDALKILSFNIFQFTAGFTFTADDGTDYFMYITPSYDVAVPID